MTNDNYTCGQTIKKRIQASPFSREDVVVHVQQKGLSFSYPGLDKMISGTFPKKNCEEILEAIAEKCGCTISDFGWEEIKQTA